jgi:hypothetical protein
MLLAAGGGGGGGYQGKEHRVVTSEIFQIYLILADFF